MVTLSESSNSDMPVITVQSSRLSSVLREKKLTAHSSDTSRDAAMPEATASSPAPKSRQGAPRKRAHLGGSDRLRAEKVNALFRD